MNHREYNPSQIEPKWQSVWQEEKLFQAKDFDNRPKKYILVEFPFTSAEGLHVGHCLSYTAHDLMARRARMNGFNVLYPMGYDSFGLPTENYAIKTGRPPQEINAENTANFRRQMEQMGISFDWDREIDTSQPEYYRWTQWIFLQFFKHDLAYKKEMPINWCPSCKIGLANEEVVAGKCDRCGTKVTKKNLSQWMLKITAYADKLLEGLNEVDYLPQIKEQQINWIGRSEGANINFDIQNSPHQLTVFTTRPDTLFGVTYMALAPEHAIIKEIVSSEQRAEVEQYIDQAMAKSNIERQENKEKTGVFTGAYAINPANQELIPIWVADYVLAGYGTGAIMAVPAHDQRDWEFAHQFDLPIIQVIDQKNGQYDLKKAALTDIAGGFLINSGEFDGLACDDAIGQIAVWLEKNGTGQKTVNYNLNDWVFSRQHYWGEPIPVVFCDKCGTVPLPEDQLPLELPAVEKYQPTDTGESPLASVTDWVNTTCPTCGGPAKRETDTMPNWAGSSWYFLRFCDPHNDKKFADFDKLKYWTPVDHYNGGMEHVTLHLLYSRFWHRFLFDLDLVPTKEPYQKRIAHGMILGEGGMKMSKSKGNVINPTNVINEYGADTLRAYVMFMGPYEDDKPWDTQGVKGVSRFLYKVWNLAQEIILANDKIQETPEQWLYSATEIREVELATLIHKSIKKITEQYDKFSYNTVVSHLMILTNELIVLRDRFNPAEDPAAWRQALEALLLLLSPVCPHIAEELWHELGHTRSISTMSWPAYNPDLIKDDTVIVPIQVNGKRRGEIVVPTDISEEDILGQVKEIDNIKTHLAGKKVVKEIYVPGKIVNIVIK